MKYYILFFILIWQSCNFNSRRLSQNDLEQIYSFCFVNADYSITQIDNWPFGSEIDSLWIDQMSRNANYLDQRNTINKSDARQFLSNRGLPIKCYDFMEKEKVYSVSKQSDCLEVSLVPDVILYCNCKDNSKCMGKSLDNSNWFIELR